MRRPLVMSTAAAAVALLAGHFGLMAVPAAAPAPPPGVGARPPQAQQAPAAPAEPTRPQFECMELWQFNGRQGSAWSVALPGRTIPGAEFIRQKLPKYGVVEKGLPSLDDAQVRVNVLAALGADGWELVCVHEKGGEDATSGKWTLTSWYLQRRVR